MVHENARIGVVEHQDDSEDDIIHDGHTHKRGKQVVEVDEVDHEVDDEDEEEEEVDDDDF